MVTREEIKDETNKLFDRCYTKGSRGLMVFQRQKFLNELFPLLDSLGVVVKVDRELPLVTEVDVIDWNDATLDGIKTGQRFMVDAGYVATKSLIGVSSPPTFLDGSTLALADPLIETCPACKKEICECLVINRGSFAKYVEEGV